MSHSNHNRNPEPEKLLDILLRTESLSPDKLQIFEEAIASCSRLGQDYDLEGDLDRAEYQYLLALKLSEALLRITGEQIFSDIASENCQILADICMQQGNMHGADHYYAQLLLYRKNAP